jgi:hypothetical protein
MRLLNTAIGGALALLIDGLWNVLAAAFRRRSDSPQPQGSTFVQ